MDLSNPALWLTIAFFTFLVLFGKKIAHAIGRMLDMRSGQIAATLREAENLKNEAEALLASWRKKCAESEKEAAEIIADARAQAERMIVNAEADLKVALERRLRQSMERIEQQEREALRHVRDHVIDLTVAASRTLITGQMNTLSNEEMVGSVVSDLERKLH